MKLLDQKDKLRSYRKKFHFPTTHDDLIYLNGNSLGLQPKHVENYLQKEINDWKQYGVEGHFNGETPWLTYQENLTDALAQILGAFPMEVIAMNTLTVNLHLMMVSFYQPTDKKYKILMEYSPFPSDIYALKSQIKYHGFEPDTALIELQPDIGQKVSKNRIKKTIENNKDELALILIGGVNYYTGQTYDMQYIVELAHEHDILVGFDLAHAIGNVELQLHDWNVDFAVYCTYKYLNAGPGAIGGVFVHEKHMNADLPRFEGWWGNKIDTRFEMNDEFEPTATAEAWQLSNPSVFAMAPLKASLDLFLEVGMRSLIEKSQLMIRHARKALKKLEPHVSIITPDEELSGCQLSLVIDDNAKQVFDRLHERGVVCDWREPDVIRIAFAPLYNSFQDIAKFVKILKNAIKY